MTPYSQISRLLAVISRRTWAKTAALSISALLVAAGMVFFAHRLPEQPTIRGRQIRSWLTQYRTNMFAIEPGEIALQEDARDAIRELGTNGIPALIELLKKEDGRTKSVLWRIRFIRRAFGGVLVPASLLRAEGVLGFEILNGAAAPAVPELAQLFDTSTSISSKNCAAAALGAIGPPAIGATSNLLKGLANTNDIVRIFAIRALDSIQPPLPSVLPPLLAAVNDPNGSVRLTAIRLLGRYGPEAQSALPTLDGMLGSTDEAIRAAAQSSILKIQPKEKAGRP